MVYTNKSSFNRRKPPQREFLAGLLLLPICGFLYLTLQAKQPLTTPSSTGSNIIISSDGGAGLITKHTKDEKWKSAANKCNHPRKDFTHDGNILSSTNCSVGWTTNGYINGQNWEDGKGHHQQYSLFGVI